MARRPKPGDEIKVGLPGESMWAKVTGIGRHGQLHAVLLNESIHEAFSFGDRVQLGLDGYTVVEPRRKIEAVERDLAEWRLTQGLRF